MGSNTNLRAASFKACFVIIYVSRKGKINSVSVHICVNNIGHDDKKGPRKVQVYYHRNGTCLTAEKGVYSKQLLGVSLCQMRDQVPFRTFVGTSFINHVRSSEAVSDTLLFLIETYFWPEHATDR